MTELLREAAALAMCAAVVVAPTVLAVRGFLRGEKFSEVLFWLATAAAMALVCLVHGDSWLPEGLARPVVVYAVAALLALYLTSALWALLHWIRERRIRRRPRHRRGGADQPGTPSPDVDPGPWRGYHSHSGDSAGGGEGGGGGGD